MSDDVEEQEDDEGWIYLTHEERQVYQKEVNRIMRKLLDSVAPAPHKHVPERD